MVPEVRPTKILPPPSTLSQHFRWLPLLALAGLGLCPTRVSAQPNVKGVWSKPFNIGGVAVHMMVAPSSEDTLHSQVFWWANQASGGFLRWGIPSPGTDTVSRAFPLSPAGNYSAGTYTAPDYNHFCANATRLADGRIFVAGGTAAGAFEVGIRNNSILDPATRTFVGGDTLAMSRRRWYPTATTLRDGRILIHSGSEYFHVHLFGGRDTASVRPDSLVRLAVTDSGMWDGDVTDPTSSNWPQMRDLHSMVPNAVYANTEYFGGRDASGNALDKLCFAYRSGGVNDPEYAYTWSPITTSSDPNGPPSSPAARYLAAATHLNNGDLVVFGGTDGTNVYGDLWVLQRTVSLGSYTYTWYHATQTGTVPPARCGGTLMRLEGVSPDTLLLFGGANGLAAIPTDSTVHSLTLTFGGVPAHYTAAWGTVAIASAPTANPGPRTQAAMLMDESERYHTSGGDEQHRALLFGGRTETGALGNDLWAFWMVDSAGSHFGEWQKIPIKAGGPSARRLHAMALESRLDRLMLFGGETNLTGARSDESWTLLMPSGYYYTSTDSLGWSAYPPSGQKPLGHVSGLSADMFPGVAYARVATSTT